jgi:hypothetical protein
MDITNLDAFAPKPKSQPKNLNTIFEIKGVMEPVKVDKITDTVPTTNTELTAVDTINLPLSSIPIENTDKNELKEVPQTTITKNEQGLANPLNKPVIDLYILSRNCTEYITLNEQSRNLELQINSKLLIDREKHKRTYIHNLLRDIGTEDVEIEAKYFIFKDKLIKDYHLYLETEDKLVIDKFINTGFVTLTKPGKIEILRIDSQPYYNHDYCDECIFTKICQRRKLEEN